MEGGKGRSGRGRKKERREREREEEERRRGRGREGRLIKGTLGRWSYLLPSCDEKRVKERHQPPPHLLSLFISIYCSFVV